ncbi:hypothetical protein PHYSODRAFT_331264 [Phytophthora sojae]|uniref:Uncharacterized protein n=1 Tax=Phytophthora sojae (strain P6497) TaxID=1094619 RepID=G4ZIL6_PHYSP|nr:hypothetical protein PHYSODRAFT_331264 [Phytophthora sojae]EGZ17260.1 hypothetical protein PHYSODRAFT_331264 [Phytophthora sojae]|eukprot:XP_009526318.1 hypothetical protein PHYSODRAFT_331264 [Phytophthora sojae]
MMKKKSGISIRAYAAAASATARREPQNPVRRPQQIDSALQVLMEERERATLQKAIDSRPINTKRKYEGYQKEFVEWSQLMGFGDGVTATGSKLHLFLDTQVVGRESKKKKKGKVIGGINGQVANKMNANDHPRTYKVKQLLSTVQAETTATRKKTTPIAAWDRC